MATLYSNVVESPTGTVSLGTSSLTISGGSNKDATIESITIKLYSMGIIYPNIGTVYCKVYTYAGTLISTSTGQDLTWGAGPGYHKEVTFTFAVNPTIALDPDGRMKYRVFSENFEQLVYYSLGYNPDAQKHLIVIGDLESGAPSKATNPSPTDASNGEGFSDWTLTWNNGGGADTYNLYGIGWDGYTGPIVTGLTSPSYTFPEDSIYRFSNLSTSVGWRIDSVNDSGTTTGDEWTFDPRPVKASTPFPADASTGRSLNTPGLSWTAGDGAETYDVWFGEALTLKSSAQEATTWSLVDELPLSYNTTYTWRIDSNNEFGTTTGDEWTFDTEESIIVGFSPPSQTYWYGSFYYRLLPGGDHPPDGTENIDYEILDDYLPNFIRTNKRLVVFARNNLYYEE